MWHEGLKIAYEDTQGNVVICGDSQEVLPLIPEDSIDLVVTSPPYNCRTPYDSFADETPWDEYYYFMGKIVKEMYRCLRVGGTVAINVPGFMRFQRDHQYAHTWNDYDPEYSTHRGSEKVLGKGRVEPVGMRLFQIMYDCDRHMREPITWVKGSEGNAMCSDFRMGCDSDPYNRSCQEWILLGSKGRWYHRGGTGRRGKDAVPFLEHTKDVWFILPVSDKQHPATFPEELPFRLVKLFVHAGDAVVMDPFFGVGNTGLACLNAGVRFIGIERSAHYCNISADRLRERRLELDFERRQLRFFEEVT